MDTKAAFEKWFGENFSFGCFSDEDREEYKVYCWLSWRDSRRAIEIELPRKVGSKSSWQAGQLMFVDEVVDAITSHGIRIKGKTE